MSTFITGGCGFVGLALAEHLLAQGEAVTACDRSEPPAKALRRFAALPGSFRFEPVDVCERYALADALRRTGARRLVTLAAVTAGEARERSDPQGIFDVRDTPSAPLQVLRLASRGEAVVLPRAGLRDWLYVRDAAAALAALLERPHWPHDTYNLGAGFTWSLADWCESVAARVPGFRWRLAEAGEPANVDFYAPYDRASMDIARLRADTGFVPRYPLAAAAADLYDWLHHD